MGGLKRGVWIVVILLVISTLSAIGQPIILFGQSPGEGEFAQRIPGNDRVNHGGSSFNISIIDSQGNSFTLTQAGLVFSIPTASPYQGDNQSFLDPPKFSLPFDACYDLRKKPYSLENFDIVVENMTNFCSRGVEGPVNATYTNFPLKNGVVIDTDFQNKVTLETHIVDWDADPQKYCKDTCVALNSNYEPEFESNIVEVGYNSSVSFCCGDDINTSLGEADCGRTQNNFACLGLDLEPSNLIFDLVDRTSNAGNIQDIKCGDIDVVASDSTWLRCGNFDTRVSNTNADGNFQEFDTAIIQNHGFICEVTNDLIYECSASGTSYLTTIASRQKQLGESVKNVSGQNENLTYYCVEDDTWQHDLDGNYQEACESSAAGFTWTGTMCCSEQEDEDEYYNDPILNRGQDPYLTPGGCWNKEYIGEGSHPQEASADILEVFMVNGTFHGCNLNASNPYLDLTDNKTGTGLIENENVCTLLDPDFGDAYGIRKTFCGVNGEWQRLSTLSYHPITELNLNATQEMNLSSSVELYPSNPSESCCPVGDCWNGSSCIQNQKGKPDRLLYQGKTCEDGSWVTAEKKFNWDLTAFGYCEEPQTQCYVESSFVASIPSCIDSLNYTCDQTGNCDFFCDAQGEWTTRTKYLATQLKKHADDRGVNDYEMYCDTNIETITNHINYELSDVYGSGPTGVPLGIFAETLLGNHCTVNDRAGNPQADQPCVSSICVLKENNGASVEISIGLTLNGDLNDVAESPLRLFGEQPVRCDAAAGTSSTGFVHCSGSDLYYNPTIHSLIYTQANLREDHIVPDLDQFFATFVTRLIDEPYLISISSIPGTLGEYEFMQDASIFEILYFNHKPSSDIYAYYEAPKQDGFDMKSHVVVNYPDLGDDLMCKYFTNLYDQVECNPPNDYYIFIEDEPILGGSYDENILVTRFRNDVSAKLRT